jgi:hypothetical protein
MRILLLKLGHRVKYIVVNVTNLTKLFCLLVGTIVASISIVTSDGSPTLHPHPSGNRTP